MSLIHPLGTAEEDEIKKKIETGEKTERKRGEKQRRRMGRETRVPKWTGEEGKAITTLITRKIQHVNPRRYYTQGESHGKVKDNPKNEPRERKIMGKKEKQAGAFGALARYLLFLNFSPVCCMVYISSPGATSSGGWMSLKD